MEESPTHSNTVLTEATSLPLFRKQLYFTLCTVMAANTSWPTPANATARDNGTSKAFSVFDGCDSQVEGILFDLTLQCINVVVGIPANLLVIAILARNRKEPSTSDIYLGSLAFMDAYFGSMTPVSFLNLYHWQSKEVWSALKFSYGVKDTSGPLFLSCICLDRFLAVVFPLAFGRLKRVEYRLSLSALVFGLTFAYSAAKVVGGLPDFEKVFTGEILATFTWMVVCNASILWALKKSGGVGKDDMRPMKRKAFKIVLSILCIIVVNYLPPVALFPFEDYYSPDVFRCYVQPVGFAFLNISSTIQPLVYLSRLDKVPFLSDACARKWCPRIAEKKEKITPAREPSG
ncbi:G-protein coupled receptor 4-like [Hippocampus zosterae]|uniref:G-protein coupled receptor 4-like n=1 Tax=Hippocampus zosterae TaxID=109293 RepID=UPI00223DE462|nr:G-protein coupled receptor 4-like [Hippocampus zosterae]